jgi:hypothetical protein
VVAISVKRWRGIHQRETTMARSAMLGLILAIGGCGLHSNSVVDSTPQSGRALQEGTEGGSPESGCILRSGTPELVRRDLAVRDTLWVGGLPYPLYAPAEPPFPDSMAWFISRQPITFNGQTFVWYGNPVAAPGREIVPVGEYQGVTVYTEFPMEEKYQAIFVSVAPGCAFQPYYFFTGDAWPADGEGSGAELHGLPDWYLLDVGASE